MGDGTSVGVKPIVSSTKMAATRIREVDRIIVDGCVVARSLWQLAAD